MTGEKLDPKQFGGACNLGSLFLTNFVENPFTPYARINTGHLITTINGAVKMLDNIIDVNTFPDPIFENYQKNFRTIGLGITGLADMLVMLGYRYDSYEGRQYASDLMNFIAYWAYTTSCTLALEKGSFPFFDKEKFLQSGYLTKHLDYKPVHNEFYCDWNTVFKAIDNNGIRNARLLSIAPTGTLSLTFGNNCSSGIEPIFNLSYDRKVKIGGQDESNAKIVKMMDYAYYLAEKSGHREECEKKGLFVTATEMPVEAHIEMLGMVAYHVDMSVSKCVAEGTLIQTNKGILPIEKLGNAMGEDTFGEPLDDLYVIDMNGQWKKVTSHYSGGKRKTKQIKFENGYVLEGSTVHKLLTIDGNWKSLSELKVGDYIQYRIEDYKANKGNQIIDFSPNYLANAKRINFPKTMNKDLALFLGMMCADGSTCESSGGVVLTCANDTVSKIFTDLVKKIFGVDTKTIFDKRTKNCRAIYFTSREAVRFIESLIGKGCVNKHVPEQILKGSSEEQLHFINGVTLDGYNLHNGLCIYEGYSQRLANELFSICWNNGIYSAFHRKKVKNGRLSKYAYGVVAYSNRIIPLEKHKHSDLSKRIIIKVPDELKKVNLNCSHPSYSTLRGIRQKGYTTMRECTLSQFNINVDHTIKVLRVTDIKDSESNVYDIEVEDSHSYLINGIVSHNTINVPESATFEQTKDIYKLCHQYGIKGCTIYRPTGFRDSVLISEEESKKNTQKESSSIPNSSEELKRGFILVPDENVIGKKKKLITGCGSLHCSAWFDPDNGDLLEVFLDKGSTGGCDNSLTGLSRMISLAARGGVGIGAIADQLKSCGSCPSYAVRSAKQRDTSKGSCCPSAVANAILEMYKQVQEEYFSTDEFDEDNTNKKGHSAEEKKSVVITGESKKSGCPVCGEELIPDGNCTYCPSCGWSKCG